MHILYLTNEYPKKGVNGGGIGSVVQFLAKELIQKNIKVSVIGINNSYLDEYNLDDSIEVHRLRKSKWKFGKFYDHTQRIISKIAEINSVHKIDIVEGSELNFAFFPKRTTYKKVIRLHGGHHFFAIELNKKPAIWRSFQEKKSFKNANAFIAVSNYVGCQTQKYLNHNFDFKTIYNSVDTDKFSKSDPVHIIKNTILFVGTVCEKKGVNELVQAMPYVIREIPNVHLKIVGRDWKFPNGDSYISYLKSIISTEVSDQIDIIGAVPHFEIPSLIEKANICVYPSHMEAMPIAWLEGLAMGKIVVASDIGPGREAIVDGETGLLANPYSPKDIAEKIILSLTDIEASNKRANLAREDILSRFNVERIVEENINFYKDQLI